MAEKQSVEINILGQKYTLRGDSDPAYMQELASQVDGRMRELSKPGDPIHRVAILTAFILMDDLAKARRALDAERQRFDAAARSAAQVDLRLQSILEEAARPEPPAPQPLLMEEQPEILDVESRLQARVADLFDEEEKP
jgi:cell division protein ZapA (FtsZ GTPase activity inhibitor)